MITASESKSVGEAERAPCPFCEATSNVYEASGMTAGDYATLAEEPEFLCPRCGLPLKRVAREGTWTWTRMFPEAKGCE